MEVISRFVPGRQVIVDALRPFMKSSFKEVLEEPIPEAWLVLLRRLDRLDQEIPQRDRRAKS